jgi:DNA-binding beta-propeller fold protein YncE
LDVAFAARARLPPDLRRPGCRTRGVDRRAFLLGAASLALAPQALATPRRRPLALVTADLEARLVAVDLASGRVHRHLSTEPRPRSIETVGGTAVVAHSELGVVTLVRAATLAVTHVLHGFGEPRYTAGHPDGRHAFVTDAARGEVVAIDVLRGRVVGRAHVGARARHVTIDPSGRRLWIALGSKAEQVAIVDVTRPSRPRLVRLLRPPFLAHDVAWTPSGRNVWVSSGDRNELALYRARTLEVVARPPADWPPQHVAFRGPHAYVTSGWNGSLRVYGSDGRSLRRTIVPVGSYNVQQADGWVVTPGLGTGSLCILDRRGRLLRRERIARSSHDACIVYAA